MRSTKARYQIDGLLAALRFLMLFGVGVVVFLEAEAKGSDPLLSLLFVLAAAAGNVLLVWLAAVSASPRGVSVLALLGDIAFVAVLLIMEPGVASPLLFYALFPIITAALRFGWLFNLTATGVIMAVFAATKIAGRSLSATEHVEAIATLMLLALTALIAGVIGGRVKSQVVHAARTEGEGELRQLRTRREQARAIFEMASTLSATLSYERILDAVLEVGTIGLREFGSLAQRLVGVVLLFGEDGLQVRAARRLTVRDESIRLATPRGVIAQAIKAAEPQVCDEPKADPDLSIFVAMHRCVTAVVVPLRAGFETFGVIVFGSPEPNVFTPDHLELLTAVASQAIIALQNAQLYTRLQEEKNRIVEIEEDARKKLARDLHDGPTQSVAAIAMRLNFTRSLLKRNPAQVDEELEKIEELARRTTKEIRHMLFTLRPLVLETQGLVPALDQYVQKLRETDDAAEVHLDASRLSDRVSQDAQGVIFYIIEEAVGNARKHAQAPHIWIRLHEGADELIAEVRDDGVGFEVQAVQASYDKRGSLGMINMNERAQLVAGTLSIASAPGEGTRVVLTMPLAR